LQQRSITSTTGAFLVGPRTTGVEIDKIAERIAPNRIPDDFASPLVRICIRAILTDSFFHKIRKSNPQTATGFGL
jgi:hypothetical protein